MVELSMERSRYRSTLGVLFGAALVILAAPAQAGQLVNGAEFGAVYTGEVLHNQRGGIETGTDYLDNLDLTLALNADQLWGWSGASFFGYVLYNNGAALSDGRVGDAQVVTNIETVRSTRLFELWYEQQFTSWDLSSRVGLYNLNAEFYATPSSAIFINASHGIGPDFSQTGEAGPSIFPNTSLALRLQQSVSDQLAWRAVVLDAVPGDPDHPARTVVELRGDEGLLAVAELDFHPGNYRLGWGGWRYSKRQTRIDEQGDAISWGSYGFAEVALAGDSLDNATVSGFVRGGVAEHSVNRFENFIGAGLTFDGALWNCPQHSFGFGYARVQNGAMYRDVQTLQGLGTRNEETDLEIVYQFPISQNLVLKPDLQYVINPNTDPNLKNSLVFGLRAQLTVY